MKVSAIPIDGYTQVEQASVWIDGVLQDSSQIIAADDEAGRLLTYKSKDGKRIKNASGNDFVREWVKADGKIKVEITEYIDESKTPL